MSNFPCYFTRNPINWYSLWFPFSWSILADSQNPSGVIGVLFISPVWGSHPNIHPHTLTNFEMYSQFPRGLGLSHWNIMLSPLLLLSLRAHICRVSLSSCQWHVKQSYQRASPKVWKKVGNVLTNFAKHFACLSEAWCLLLSFVYLFMFVTIQLHHYNLWFCPFHLNSLWQF